MSAGVAWGRDGREQVTHIVYSPRVNVHIQCTHNTPYGTCTYMYKCICIYIQFKHTVYTREALWANIKFCTCTNIHAVIFTIHDTVHVLVYAFQQNTK